MTEFLSLGPRDRRRLALAGAFLALTVGVAVGIRGFPRIPKPALSDNTLPRLAEVLSKAIETEGMDAAAARYRALRREGFPGVRESEADTNTLGYTLLGRRDTAGAIQVFRLNVETHPASANVHDSLGEAYVASGNKPLAIESYRKAVAINPKMKSALAALSSLTGAPRPPYRAMLLLHICAGALGLLSGAGAMILRKGSRRHGVAGTVFVVSMLSLSTSAVYMALVEPDGKTMNVLVGLLTFYLVATAWWTARRRGAGTGALDWAGALVALGVAAALLSQGVVAASSETEGTDGLPTVVYFAFGAVALLASLLDFRMIARGGVSGAARIARHLWRMCTALYFGVTSLFLGQPQEFPEAIRNSGLLAAPGILVVLLLVFWLVRVLLTKGQKKAAPPQPWRMTIQPPAQERADPAGMIAP